MCVPSPLVLWCIHVVAPHKIEFQKLSEPPELLEAQRAGPLLGFLFFEGAEFRKVFVFPVPGGGPSAPKEVTHAIGKPLLERINFRR